MAISCQGSELSQTQKKLYVSASAQASMMNKNKYVQTLLSGDVISKPPKSKTVEIDFGLAIHKKNESSNSITNHQNRTETSRDSNEFDTGSKESDHSKRKKRRKKTDEIDESEKIFMSLQKNHMVQPKLGKLIKSTNTNFGAKPKQQSDIKELSLIAKRRRKTIRKKASEDIFIQLQQQHLESQKIQ